VATQLALLGALSAHAVNGGPDVEQTRTLLRRSLETDRFGFVAHILKVRDGCGSGTCKTLALLRDASRIRDHLALGTFDRYLEHYQAVWARPTETVAESARSNIPAPPHKPVNIDFPSAASIPAVNIMTPEPTGPVLPGAAAAAAANPNPPTAAQVARRTHKAAAGGAATAEPAPSPQQAAPSAPTQINPPAASAGTAAHAQ
jgi:hypothetical protein